MEKPKLSAEEFAELLKNIKFEKTPILLETFKYGVNEGKQKARYWIESSISRRNSMGVFEIVKYEGERFAPGDPNNPRSYAGYARAVLMAEFPPSEGYFGHLWYVDGFAEHYNYVEQTWTRYVNGIESPIDNK